MRKMLFRMMATLMTVAVLAAGMCLCVSAASGTGTSTYYYNLQEDHRTVFNAGDEIYVSNSAELADPDYIAYGFPSDLKAKLEILEYGAYANGNGYSIKILINGYWDSCNGYLIHQSGNHWKYWCWGGAYRGYDVYIYTCQTGAFAPGDVTIRFDGSGNITGAVLFDCTSDAVPVPADMLNITDNTVNYASGDYTRTATLGGVNIVAVDSSGIYDQYFGNSSLSGPEAEAIKAELANANSDADVQRILAKTQALLDVTAAAEAQKTAIENNTDLTAMEKIVLQAAVEDALTCAKSDIQNAQSAYDAQQARSAGLQAMELIGQKTDAIAEVTRTAKAKKAAIDEMPGLSAAEKTARKDAVDSAADAAKAAINDAENTAKVSEALTNASAAMELEKDKAQAISDIILQAQIQQQKLGELPNLKEDEKAALREQLNDTVAAAKAAVEQVEEPGHLSGVKAGALAALQLKGEKAAAMDAATENTAELIARIKALEHLSGEDKLAQIEKAENDLVVTKAAINAAAGNAAVEAVAAKHQCVCALEEICAKMLDAVAAQDALSDAEKALYTEAIREKADAAALALGADPADHQRIIAEATAQMQEHVDDAVALDFVKNYVCDAQSKIYSGVTADNADQILSGEAAWSAMTEAQKAKADARIAAANRELEGAPRSYEEFTVAVNDFAAASADQFIKDYLTGKDEKIYKDANKDNYAQILSGSADWEKMSQAQKDAVNAKLTANGAKTYEDMLARAEAVKKSIVPPTGDSFALLLPVCLMVISLFAMTALCLRKRPV